MKKLLILGGNYVEKEIVVRAKKLGYYTIVTDNHENWSLSPAKSLADEGWNISWSDINSLEQKCIEEHINGVIAGFSEFRVEAMIKLCERLKLPCSLNMHQLDVTRDKILFKETCRKFGVATVPEYSIDHVEKFPVIIKPVDRAGSIGINVAYNKEDLKLYYAIAQSLSPSKQVIIEDFITNGIKFDVYYYVQNGHPYFIGSSDTIMCKGTQGAPILQKCWPFKSKYEEEYHQQVEENILKMLKGLNIKNAYATMSAFYVNGHFYFFEAGFRLSGEMSFNYQEANTGYNYIETMIRYAVSDIDTEIYTEIQTQVKHCAVLNFFVTDGIVGELVGMKKLINNSNIYALNLYLKEGDEIINLTDVYKKGAMITIICKNKKDLKNTIDWINENFDIIGINNESMIYEKVSISEIQEYYKE